MLYQFHQNGEETQKIRNRVYGKNNKPVDLIKEIIINIRKEERVKESKNVLIGMLEVLLSPMETEEKKQRLTQKYERVITKELEGRLETMCNLSRNIIDSALEKGIAEGMERGIEEGIEKGIKKERLNAIGRMLKAEETKEKILSYGYTEEEFLRLDRESVLIQNS